LLLINNELWHKSHKKVKGKKGLIKATSHAQQMRNECWLVAFIMIIDRYGDTAEKRWG